MEERTFAIELTYNEVLALLRVLDLQLQARAVQKVEDGLPVHMEDLTEPLDEYEKGLAKELSTELTKVIGGL